MGKKYHNLLFQRRVEYKQFTPVFCPALKVQVCFNSDGFNHLRYHVDGRPRPPQEQMHKLGLLPLVISAIKSATIIEYEKRLAPIGRKLEDGNKVLKEIEYWGLTAAVGKQPAKIKVILRKIGNGKVHFWSVMKLN